MLFRRGKAYSQDLRDRVFALSDAGDPVGEIAEALCVSVSYVSKALSRRRDTGERAARPQRCHVPPKLLGLYDAIRTEVTSRPDATLGELRRWLHEKHRVSASDGLMHATLARLGLTHKKDLARRRAGTARCCRGTRRMARAATWPGAGAADLSR